MPKKSIPKMKPKPNPKRSQKERFIEYAKEAGVDESGEEFERVFNSMKLKKREGEEDG